MKTTDGVTRFLQSKGKGPQARSDTEILQRGTWGTLYDLNNENTNERTNERPHKNIFNPRRKGPSLACAQVTQQHSHQQSRLRHHVHSQYHQRKHDIQHTVRGYNHIDELKPQLRLLERPSKDNVLVAPERLVQPERYVGAQQ